MSVDVITFGCRLNTYESEVIRRQARAAGLPETVVFNTCAVTAEAVRQSRQAIRRLKRERPAARIVVTGCAAQTEPGSFADMPEVALVLGNEEKLSAQAWRTHRDVLARAPFGIAAEEKVAVNDIMMVTQTATHLIDGVEGHARAFVQVQNGCDHRCTFCIIPYGRGNSRSVPMGEVVAQVRTLCRVRLSRSRPHRRRSHQLRRQSSGRAEAWHAGQADPQTRAGARAVAALVDRFGRSRSRPARCVCERRTADAASAPVAAVGRRSHPQADEAPAPARRCHRLLPAGAPAAARCGIRRRHHRRLPDRNRGHVRPLARSGRGMRADASPCVSVLAPAGDAGRAHARSFHPTSSRIARAGCAQKARLHCAGISMRRSASRARC